MRIRLSRTSGSLPMAKGAGMSKTSIAECVLHSKRDLLRLPGKQCGRAQSIAKIG